MTNCSKTKCFISVIAVFAFTMVFDWLVHGQVMKSLYMANASVFRPEPDMQKMMAFCLAFHFFMAMVVTCMFKNYKNYSAEACAADPELAKKCAPCARGMCFGLHLGLIFGLGMASSYIWFPVSGELGAAWFGAGLLKGIFVGLILGALSGKSNCEIETVTKKKKK